MEWIMSNPTPAAIRPEPRRLNLLLPFPKLQSVSSDKTEWSRRWDRQSCLLSSTAIRRSVPMGQVIDLPDPLNNTAPAASPGVDDLLAQLAGGGGDRLLGGAEVGRAGQP